LGRWAEIVVMSEEIARLIKEMEENREEEKKTEKVLVERTYTKIIPKKEISERWFFIDKSGIGTLDEAVILFDKNTAEIWLTIDNRVIVPGLTLAEIPEQLLYSKNIAVVEENGTYTLSVQNVKFAEKIVGYVVPKEVTTILGGRITIKEYIVD